VVRETISRLFQDLQDLTRKVKEKIKPEMEITVMILNTLKKLQQ